MKKLILFLTGLSAFLSCPAQQDDSDSLQDLREVIVHSFEQNRKAGSSAINIKIIERNNADRHTKSSLVNGFNTVAGVRMEERSPGSYRINIRGSSLRSPFGVRNVKVYWNDIPVTDAGGNTYFNQFAFNNFSFIEIFRGPAGSLYGAGTGGLILLQNSGRWNPGSGIEYITGSYGLQNVLASARFGNNDNRNQFSFAHNQSDGYRVQTNMRRDNFSWNSRLRLSEKQELSASLLFTDMYYQTPGALTLAEYSKDPKAARPAGGGLPSAVNAHAAIYQKNILAGFTNHYLISKAWKNSTTVYGSFAQIKNPAIRNYERRNEPGYGGRSVFTWHREANQTKWQWLGGSEFQQGYFNTQVAKNRNGNPDTLQTNDDIHYTSYSLFAQGDLSIRESWFLNGGISLNKTLVRFTRLSVYPVLRQSRRYQNELAPRISVRKKICDDLALKATLSRGFSPPTIAELLPSTGVISTYLEAESGWNYEMTANYSLFKRKLLLELTGFYFRLNNALVQRRDLSGADYFVNAGDIREKGLEFHAEWFYSPPANSFVDHLLVESSYTYDHFRYGNFKKGGEDFSGKMVPSVPNQALSALADIVFRNGCYGNITWYTASRIFLNDANTAYAPSYQLLGCRAGWKKTLVNKNATASYLFNFHIGADNLFDETYSLGNDINAAANRYYNAAPRRNYYAGVSFQWIRKPKN